MNFAVVGSCVESRSGKFALSARTSGHSRSESGRRGVATCVVPLSSLRSTLPEGEWAIVKGEWHRAYSRVNL